MAVVGLEGFRLKWGGVLDRPEPTRRCVRVCAKRTEG